MSATTTALLEDRHGQRGLRGWHVLICLLAFFFIVIGVNAAMVYSAISTYSGVVSAEPYRKGLHYNDRVEADQRQQRLGWQEMLAVDRSGRVELILAKTDGQPINGLDVQIVLGRPSTNRLDVKVGLVGDAAGHYTASVAPLPSGSWIIGIEARASAGDADPIFRARKRIWIAP